MGNYRWSQDRFRPVQTRKITGDENEVKMAEMRKKVMEVKKKDEIKMSERNKIDMKKKKEKKRKKDIKQKVMKGEIIEEAERK